MLQIKICTICQARAQETKFKTNISDVYNIYGTGTYTDTGAGTSTHTGTVTVISAGTVTGTGFNQKVQLSRRENPQLQTGQVFILLNPGLG